MCVWICKKSLEMSRDVEGDEELKVSFNNTLYVYCTHVSVTYKQQWNSHTAKITLIDKTGEFISSD